MREPNVYLPMKPDTQTLVKLGSIVRHVEEAIGTDGHAFDWAAIRTLLEDDDVVAWLEGMDKSALLPVRRNP